LKKPLSAPIKPNRGDLQHLSIKEDLDIDAVLIDSIRENLVHQISLFVTNLNSILTNIQMKNCCLKALQLFLINQNSFRKKSVAYNQQGVSTSKKLKRVQCCFLNLQN